MKLNYLIGDKAFYRRVLLITIPILIQNVITNFVSLLDNVMVGLVGTEQMTGVAIVNQLVFVYNLCIFGAVSGGGIFTAQFFGKSDHKGVRDTFRMKIISTAIITVGALILLIFKGEFLVSLFIHTGEENIDLALTMEYAKKYLNIALIGLPAFSLMQAYSDTLRSTGETGLPMKASIVAVLVNTGLNYVLIFGKFGAPKLGVEGAAIATITARYVETAIIVGWTHLNKAKNPFIQGAYKNFKVPMSLVRSIVKKGVPLVLNEAFWSIGMTTLLQAYSIRGIETVSAMNISSTISNLFNCVFLATGNAIGIIVGQLLGAGQIEKAKEEDSRLIFTTVVACAFVGVIMAILAPMIPQIYNTTDKVKELACSFLIVSAVMMPVSAFAHSAYFSLRSGGKTFITFIVDSGFVWCISIPVAYALVCLTSLPIVTVFALVQALEILKMGLGMYMLKQGAWLNNLVDKH